MVRSGNKIDFKIRFGGKVSFISQSSFIWYYEYATELGPSSKYFES